MKKPLAVDLFCGLGGWAEGFLAEGYDVIGFDIERRDYGTGGYPGQLVLQDVLTLDGRQFSKAAVIVASPPCTEYSSMAQPWSRAKQIARVLRGDKPPCGCCVYSFPYPYAGSRTTEELNLLFNACFRIASEAGVPLVVENVKGAEPWVGLAKAHFGSFYLWGDINSVGGAIAGPVPKFGELIRAKARKNNGGSWFAIGSPGQTNVGQNPDGRKVPMNFHEHEKTGKPGRSFQSVAVEGVKSPGLNWSGHGEPGYKPQGFNVTNAQRFREEHGKQNEDGGGIKVSGDWFGSYTEQKAAGTISPGRLYGKRSDSRKAASAQIAKIPFPLAQHIARVFKPR
jgi:hypothetical protein